MNQVYKNTPWGNVTIYDTWPLWQQKIWFDMLAQAGCLPQAPAWIPTFDPPYTITTENGIKIILDPHNFATEATCYELIRRFGADHIALTPFGGSGGPNVGPTNQRWIVWVDGIAIPAGWLARHFVSNPEDEYPHVAENACWHDINDTRRSGQRLPKGV